MENVPWWEKYWLNLVMIGLQLISFIVCCLTGNITGAILAAGGIIFAVLEIVAAEKDPGAAKVLDGLGTISNGASCIMTGIPLLGSCHPVGFVIGIICVAVGYTTVLAGENQIIYGATGENVIRERTGMSQDTYDAIYLGLNIASAVCTTVGSAYGSLRGINCFIAGTLVQTEDGLKPIEQIEVGDLVLAYDEETGKQGYKKVVRLFRNQTDEWYHIHVNGEEIVCTGGHPFYVLNAGNNRTYIEFEGTKANANGKWVMAKDLQIGDNLLLSDGSRVIIEEIQVEKLQTPETTYNFEVEDFHTYYVTESNVLVHNACPEEFLTPQEAIKEGKDFLGEGYIKVDKGYYKSADGLRVMHFDYTHHMYKGVRTMGHINLYTFKPKAKPGRYKLIGNRHLFLIWGA